MDIEKIEVKEKYVKIVCVDETDKLTFKIAIDDYLKERYNVDQKLSDEQLDKLQHYHRYYYCFTRCLNKLNSRDYTVKEIETYLKKYGDLSQNEKQEIINDLSSYGYLQDESVAESQLYIDQYHLVGKKNSARELKKRGVDKEVIEEVLSQVDESEEKQRAIQKGQQLLKGCKDKSYKETIYYIKNKLMLAGFSDVNEVIEQLDIEFVQEKEERLLENQFNKLKKKYEKKYSGKALYNAYYQYLANKGFESSMITTKLSKEEEQNEDK